MKFVVKLLKRSIILLISIPGAALVASSCENKGKDVDAVERQEREKGDAAVARPEGWSEETHGKDVKPDYALLFDVEKVHSLHITIAPEDYATMESNLKEITSFGGMPLGDVPFQPGMGPGVQGGMAADAGFPGPMDSTAASEACAELSDSDSCEINGEAGTCRSIIGNMLICIPDNFAMAIPEGGMPGAMPDGGMPFFNPGDFAMPIPEGGMPGAMPDGGMPFNPGDMGNFRGDMLSEDPVTVPVTVSYEGRDWYHVAMRYKGNSSLATAAQSGNGKKPFRLNFDSYANDFPEIKNQRFYGFRKLTFSSNWLDNSQLRETLVTEIFRDRGIAAARCAFYRIFVDVGEGDVYWGLYTMIEDPDDGAMLNAQFGGSGGNLYKPEGTGANWTGFSTDGFVKKTNQEEADYSDVIAAIDALRASREDTGAWRAELERRFDVDLFLNWLAVNTTIQNWDSYGTMAHNYYLYGDPAENGRLNWIPWDHNLSMMISMMGGGFPPFGSSVPNDAESEIFHINVGDNWPLISVLLSDQVYQARYREHLEHALEGAFAVDAMDQRMHVLHGMIAPYVVGPEGEIAGYTTITSAEAFNNAIDGEGGLLEHIKSRHKLVKAALASY